MAATKGYRAAFASHDPEQSYISVFHFLAHTGGDAPLDLSVPLKSGAFPTSLAKTLRNDGQIDTVTVTEIMAHGDPTPPRQDTQVVGIAGAYTQTSGHEARGVCGLIRLRSNVGGRGTHGWTYGFPVTNESGVDATGTKTAGTYQTQLAAEATGLNGVLTVSGAFDSYDLAVFSRARWARGESAFLFSVTACTPQAKLHFLRRRSNEPR